MPKRSTVLRELLRQRQAQTYAPFCRHYDEAAGMVDPMLVGRWPSRGQFARWLNGDLKGLPSQDHCRVLEAMFTGVSAAELFSVPDRSRTAVPSLPGPVHRGSPALPTADASAPPIPAARRASGNAAAGSAGPARWTP